MTIELGSKVKDKVTGFQGIAIGVTRWLTGCLRFTVQPQGLDKEGKQREAVGFDEHQLEVIASPAKTGIHATPQAGPATPGGPAPKVARRADVKR